MLTQFLTPKRIPFLIAFAFALSLMAGASIYLALTREDGVQLAPNGCKAEWARADLPLFLAVGESARDRRAKIEEAAKLWNAHGVVAIVVDLDAALTGRSMVPILAGDEICEGVDGSDEYECTTVHIRDCTIRSAVISLEDDRPEDLDPRIIAHGIGHALGFGHDTFEDSVMFHRADRGEFRIPAAAYDTLARQLARPASADEGRAPR